MNDEEKLALLQEWQQIASQKAMVRGQRDKGLIGILVANDPAAKKYQELNDRAWVIRCQLFGFDALEI